jgi:hypothetical protein
MKVHSILSACNVQLLREILNQMFLEIHAILHLVGHMHNVEILMVLLLVLVCQITLDLHLTVVQNVQ